MHVAGEAETTPINPSSAMITSLIRKLKRCKRIAPLRGGVVSTCLFMTKISSSAVLATSCLNARVNER